VRFEPTACTFPVQAMLLCLFQELGKYATEYVVLPL
jgi:hypothetical protein